MLLGLILERTYNFLVEVDGGIDITLLLYMSWRMTVVLFRIGLPGEPLADLPEPVSEHFQLLFQMLQIALNLRQLLMRLFSPFA